jgi:hypothetical protein
MTSSYLKGAVEASAPANTSVTPLPGAKKLIVWLSASKVVLVALAGIDANNTVAASEIVSDFLIKPLSMFVVSCFSEPKFFPSIAHFFQHFEALRKEMAYKTETSSQDFCPN